MPVSNKIKRRSPIMRKTLEASKIEFGRKVNCSGFITIPVIALVFASWYLVKDPPLLENQKVITENATPAKNIISIKRMFKKEERR